jgi:hypothetical protein
MADTSGGPPYQCLQSQQFVGYERWTGKSTQCSMFIRGASKMSISKEATGLHLRRRRTGVTDTCSQWDRKPAS